MGHQPFAMCGRVRNQGSKRVGNMPQVTLVDSRARTAAPLLSSSSGCPPLSSLVLPCNGGLWVGPHGLITTIIIVNMGSTTITAIIFTTITTTTSVSYTHLTLPTTGSLCRSRWSPYH